MADRQPHSRREAIASLKWPMFVAGAGMVRCVRYSAIRTVNGATECRVSKVRKPSGWSTVPEQRVWISDDCIVSRQFIDQAPSVQEEMFK